MASERQKAAARKNVKKTQTAAKGKQRLKHLSAATRSALVEEANKVRRGEAKTRKDLDAEARSLSISGRSKMGKDKLRDAIARAR
ncbi:MAG TPA: hypothetical protein VH081_07390 [Solirubrobacteraceae bacterium]|jgi:hypothetical protein|nr:hypothetical protein [Solirubrobacteraceae bacterium]